MSVLTILVGIPSSGKTTVAQQLAEERDSLYLSSNLLGRDSAGDLAAKDRNHVIYEAAKPKLIDAMREGRSIVLDSAYRVPKYRKPYLDLAKQHGYRTEAIFINVPLEYALEQNSKRADENGQPVSEAVIRRYERLLQIPTYPEGFDRIEVRTNERVNDEAVAFFHEKEQELIDDPVTLIRRLEADGRLERWLPELHRAIPIDQHNPHHRFTIYEHILKATETMQQTNLKLVWTMLLHDIGKAYPGVKQFTGVMSETYGLFKKKDRVVIENGADIREGRDSGQFYVVQGTKIPREYVHTNLNGHFYDHENLGAQMAFRVMTRFGYPHDFALDVATLVQFHMLMPREIEKADLAQITKFYHKVGNYAGELMMVRLADDRGK